MASARLDPGLEGGGMSDYADFIDRKTHHHGTAVSDRVLSFFNQFSKQPHAIF